MAIGLYSMLVRVLWPVQNPKKN